MEELKNRYLDFVDELDPYRDKEEDPQTLSEMLYNLICIKEDWTEMDPELMELLDDTIQRFEAAGIKTYRATTYEEIILTQYTNCVAFLVAGGLSEQQKKEIKELEHELKNQILKMMEGK